MNYLYLILIIIFLSNCQNRNRELEGHWHLYVENNDFDEYEILNINGDTIINFGDINYITLEVGSLKNGKNIDVDNRQILLYDGMYGLFEYQLESDTIYLNERTDMTSFGVNFLGIRYKAEDCNQLKDFYSRDPIIVQLPEQLITDDIANLERGFIFDVMVGENKRTERMAIQVDNRIVEKEDLLLELEKFKLKIPENRLNDIILRLHIDKRASIDILGEQYELIREFPFKQVVIQKVDKFGKPIAVKE